MCEGEGGWCSRRGKLDAKLLASGDDFHACRCRRDRHLVLELLSTRLRPFTTRSSSTTITTPGPLRSLHGSVLSWTTRCSTLRWRTRSRFSSRRRFVP